MRKGRIIIISGPSGSGKTTLYKKLLSDKSFKSRIIRSVSLTTRPRRPGERPGRDYHFISLKQFLYKQRAGHLLESERVFNDYYGTPCRPVRLSLRRGKNVLLSIDVKGARLVRAKAPDSLGIFVRPPSLNELKKRLVKRGTENHADLKLRLRRARLELTAAKDYDYVIINDDLSKCYRDLKEILSRELFAG